MKKWISDLGTLGSRTDVWVVALVSTLIWALANNNEFIITLVTSYMAADFAVDHYIEGQKFTAYAKAVEHTDPKLLKEGLKKKSFLPEDETN